MIVCSLSLALFSQNIEGVNARIDATGGIFSPDDIGWAIGSPSAIANFPNLLQGNISLLSIPGVDITYGSIIGVLGIGNSIRLGITFNDRTYMPSAFYTLASKVINAPLISDDENARKFPMIPGINFCVKINDDNSFGLGFFAERASYSKEETMRDKYISTDTSIIEYNNTVKNKSITVIGATVDARIKTGPIYLRPGIRIGLPKIAGTEQSDRLTKTKGSVKILHPATSQKLDDKDITFSTKNNMLIRGGILAEIPVKNANIYTGVWYNNKKYQFKKDSVITSGTLDTNGSMSATTTNRSEYLSSNISIRGVDYFLGCRVNYPDGFFITPEYDGAVQLIKSVNSVTSADTSKFVLLNTFRLGMEKGVKNFWFTDELLLRAGITGYWNHEIHTISDSADSVVNLPWTSYLYTGAPGKQARITGGFGLKKGRGQFDISVDFLSWSKYGAIAGPSVVMASLTVDFGRKKEF